MTFDNYVNKIRMPTFGRISKVTMKRLFLLHLIGTVN